MQIATVSEDLEVHFLPLLCAKHITLLNFRPIMSEDEIKLFRFHVITKI